MLRIKFVSTSWDIALMWMPRKTFDDKSVLTQLMVGAVRPQAITRANEYSDLCRHMRY